MQRFIDCMLRELPQFQSVHIRNIYVACLTDPKGCSLNKIKLPEIELTLTKLGTFRTPSDPSKVMNFFKDQVFVALKRFVDQFVEWKVIGSGEEELVQSPSGTYPPHAHQQGFKVPTGIRTGCYCFNLRYPSGINMRTVSKWGVSVSIPNVHSPFRYSTTHCQIRLCHIPNGIHTTTITFYYPKPKWNNPFSRCVRL